LAQTATTIEMLAGAYKHRRRVQTSSNGARVRLGKTHDHIKVRKITDYHCSTSPGGIRVVDLYFSRRRHDDKDDRMNGGEQPRLGKEL
jgi:hypothetical protein